MVRWAILLPVVVILVAFRSSVRMIEDDERIVVLRRGRYHGVYGPGRVWLLPIIDRGIRVNLFASIPGWRGMPKRELEARIAQLALTAAKKT